MENLNEEGSSTNLCEMPPSENNSERSRLVAPSTISKPSYLNLASNICALIFVGIVAYCCFVEKVTLFSFHPSLMSLGWMIFMTSAINAVTPGDLATEWMPIRLRSARHWVIQLLGGIIIIIGFIVILSNKIILNKSHFTTLHAKFGLASLVFMIITMIGGIAALYSLKIKQYLAPIYTKLVHASFGLLTFSLGIITILLGVFSDKSVSDALRYTSLTLVLTVMVFTILRPCLKIYFRFKERLDNVN